MVCAPCVATSSQISPSMTPAKTGTSDPRSKRREASHSETVPDETVSPTSSTGAHNAELQPYVHPQLQDHPAPRQGPHDREGHPRRTQPCRPPPGPAPGPHHHRPARQAHRDRVRRGRRDHRNGYGEARRQPEGPLAHDLARTWTTPLTYSS